MKKSPLQLLGPLLVLLIFCGAVYLLWWKLTAKDVEDVGRRLREIVTTRPWTIVAAIALTVLNYVVLVGYDLLAVRFVGESIPLRRVALASFTAYTCGYNFGSTFAGTSVRYRLYSAWGLPPIKILQLLVILALTFWFGLLALAGVVLSLAPLPMPKDLAWLPFADTRPLGIFLLVVALIYIALSAMHYGFVKVFRWRLPVPPFRLTIYQVLIASVDLLLVAGVLYCLWPASAPASYLQVLAIYMLVFVVGVLSHVPGGYGVQEGILITIFPDDAVRANIIASWLVFRMIYYIIPLLFAAVLLGWYELRLARRRASQSAASPQPSGDDQKSNGESASSQPRSRLRTVE